MRFEIRLANGREHATNHAHEIAEFLDSNGSSIAPKPRRKRRPGPKRKKLKR